MTGFRVPSSGGRAGGSSPASYDISVAGGVASAVNGLTGAVDYTGADVATVANLILAAWGAGAPGGVIDIVPPTTGSLAISTPILIPCGLTNFLLRCNGTTLRPTGTNKAVVSPSRLSATTTGSVNHGDTSLPLTALPSWASSGGGYVDIAGDLWQYTGVSGNTLTGAAIQNGSTTDRAGAQVIKKAFESWQNWTLRDLLIDASAIGGTVDMSLIGTAQGANTIDQHMDTANVWIDCIKTTGVPSSATGATNVRNICFQATQKKLAEALVNRIDNIRINDFDLGGGNTGILVLGSNATRPTLTQDSNIKIGDVRIRRGRWDSGSTPTAFTFSSGVQVGQHATGDGDVVIEDVRLKNSFDVGIEVDSCRKVAISRVTTVDCFNYGLYGTNFNAGPSQQQTVIREHRNEIISLSSATGVCSAIGLAKDSTSTHSLGDLIIRDSSAYFTGTRGGSDQWKGILSASGTSVATRLIVVDGYDYRVDNATLQSGGAGLVALYLQRSTGEVFMPQPIRMRCSGTCASGSVPVQGIRVDNGGTVRWSGVKPDVEHSITGVGASGTWGIRLGAGDHRGTLTGGRIGPTGDDTTPRAFQLTSGTTITPSLKLPGWDFADAPVGIVEKKILDSAQAPKISGDFVDPPLGIGLHTYSTIPVSSATVGQAMAAANDARWVRLVIPEDGYLRDVSALIQTTSGGTYTIGIMDTGQAKGNTEHTLLALSTPAAVPGAGSFAVYDPDLAVQKGETLAFYITFSDTTAKIGVASGLSGSGVYPNTNFSPSQSPGTSSGKSHGFIVAANQPTAVGLTMFTGNLGTDQIRALFEYRIASS